MEDEFAELLGNLERQYLAQFGEPLKAVDAYVVTRKHLTALQEQFIHNHICHLKGDRAARLEKKLHQAWVLDEDNASAIIYGGYVEEQKKKSTRRDAKRNGSNGSGGDGTNVLTLPDRRKSKNKPTGADESPEDVL